MEHIKKLNEMRKQVKEELNHIPRGDLNQNILRQAYWSLRLHSLGRKAKTKISKEEVLVKATKLIKKDNPAFCPRFDDKFFDVDKLVELAKNDSDVLACFQRKKK